MSRPQLVPLSYDFPKICLRYFQLRGVAEYCRRVEYRGHEAAFSADPCAVLPCDLVIRSDDALRGDTAEADDDFWFQKECLVFQIRNTGFFLSFFWISVSGRMAFQDIGDIDRVPCQGTAL